MSTDVRELTGADAPALREFFGSLPPEDRTFFFQDVTDPAVADAWAGDERKLKRCALGDGGGIVAFAALEPGVDWSSHVAELVLVVDPSARRGGIGRALARQMLIDAVEQGFKKVTVKIAADNDGAIQMFQKLGFDGEALLRDQLCSTEDGQLRDMVILGHLVEDNWSHMVTAGYDDAIG